MRILILEDSPERIQAFLRKIPGQYDLTFCETAKECINQLKGNTFDWLCLDHDLVPVNGKDSGTGYDVAKFLEKNPDRLPAIVLVHSANPVGWSNIKRAIPNAIHAPNLWEYINLVISHLNL